MSRVQRGAQCGEPEPGSGVGRARRGGRVRSEPCVKMEVLRQMGL